MRSLTSFVAMDRRHALVIGEHLPDRVQGSLLFADVSGSTPLAAALARELGPQRGTEELTVHLNRILTPMIAQVHAYGGSVITFAGDAITCWFDGDNGRRATACGLAMQQVMRTAGTFTIPGGDTAAVAVKIAVVAGDARRFAVGNPRIQIIDVLAGRLLDRMSGVESLLDRGEVGIGAEVLAWLGPEAEIGFWRTAPSGEHFAIVTRLTADISPTPWDESPALDRDVARCWVPPIIADRLVRGEGAFIAELRLAVPMFLGFKGIDYDTDEVAGEKLDTYVNWVQTVLAHYGGHLLEITMGDKGSSLGITFGAPAAYEDDPVRAVAAAMELRSPPPAMSFIESTQIGITQGQLYIGACGSDTRRTYIGLGNEANVAARLKGFAKPGQIAVSNRIASAAAGFEFEPLGPVALKGLHEPMPVFAVTGARRGRVGRTVPGRASPAMVGREAELALLSARLRALQEGESSCVVVSGEAGIGKSRLVEELQARAQASGIFTLIGSGDAIERGTPYHAWRPIFYPLFDLSDGDEATTGDGMQEHILAQIEDDAFLMERAPLLGAILPVHLPDNNLTAQMTGEVRASNTRDVLVRVLRRALLQGALKMLLILEDAHWLDSASWALVSTVAHQVHPSIQLIVMRQLAEPSSSEYEQVRDAPNTLHVQLGPLPGGDIRLLVSRSLDARELDPQVASLIVRKAEGHPFYSEELAYALRDAGLLRVDERDVCRLATDARGDPTLAFPDTIQGVITSRIDRLHPALQSLLKVASVIGRDFGFGILHDIYPVDADRPQLRANLEELERLDLLQKRTPQPELTYLFKHIITQEVAYSLMLFAQRRDLHRATAHWHEEAHTSDLSPYYGLLAHHWDRAGEPQRAVGYMGEAGEQALSSYANEEAAAYLRRALDLATTHDVVVHEDRLARWRLQLGEALISQSEYADGREQLEKGLAVLARRVPPSAFSQAIGILGQVSRQVIHRLAPARFVGRLARHQDALRRASRAYERLAEAGFVANETSLALYASLAALNAAESAGESAELARGYVAAGVMMGFASLHRVAEGYIERALDTVQRTDSMSASSHVSHAAGFYYMGVGNWRRAEKLFGSAVEISDRLGDLRGREGAGGNLGIARFLQGDFAGALELAEEVCDSACARDDALYQVTALALKASSLSHLGRPREVMEWLARIDGLVAHVPETASSSIRFMVHDLELRIYLGQSNWERVHDAVKQLLGLLSDGPLLDAGAVTGYSNLAEACLALWASHPGDRELRRQAQTACKHMGRFARVLPIGRPRQALWQGQYAWQSGRRARAQRLWQRSLVLAAQLGMAYDEGLAHHAAGRGLDAGSPERAAHLESARDIFRRLGAASSLQRVESELQSARV